MIVSKDNFGRSYQEIKTKALENDCSVLIFSAPDVDSVCATKILLSLFKSDFVGYKLVPVASYDDLTQANLQLIQGNEELRSVVLINCGGTIDLAEFFSLNENTTIYVFDSHRPTHLNNLYESDNIVMIQEETDEMKKIYLATKTLKNDDDDDDNFDEESLEGDGRERKRARYEDLDRRAKNILLREISEYYSSEYFACSTAAVLFEITVNLNKNSVELLWLSIVGITDLLLNEKVPQHEYETFCEQHNNHVLQLQGAAEAIKIEEELKLVLLRHWNVYDSMFYSPYVATRLGIWRKKGRDKLEMLLAKMGLPLLECKQRFANMDLDTKARLNEKLQEFCPRFGLPEMSFSSYVKNIGFEKISASDTVYAVETLIEQTNIFQALDSLEKQNFDLITKGIQLSKIGSQSLIMQANSLIEKKSIIKTSTFWYSIIKELDPAFAHPGSLRRLNLFLLEAVQESKKLMLPLILISPTPSKTNYFIIGGTPLKVDQHLKDKFSLGFREACEQAKGKIEFESWCVEIPKESLSKFLEALNGELSKRS